MSGYGENDLPWNRFIRQQEKQLDKQVRDAPDATITGTTDRDHLVGTSGDDVIDGLRGNDFIDGGAGNDFLIGDSGADRFVLRAGGGHDVVADFNPAEHDKILFDFGTYSDYMVFGRLYDGQTWDNFLGTATFKVNAVDVNGDGVTDTQFTVTHAGGEDSITLLGWRPEDLWGQWLVGG